MSCSVVIVRTGTPRREIELREIAASHGYSVYDVMLPYRRVAKTLTTTTGNEQKSIEEIAQAWRQACDDLYGPDFCVNAFMKWLKTNDNKKIVVMGFSWSQCSCEAVEVLSEYGAHTLAEGRLAGDYFFQNDADFETLLKNLAGKSAFMD